MPRLVSDLVTEVRGLVQDVNSGRYTDDLIIRGLNNALLRIRYTRPDAFIGNYDDPTPQYTKLQLTEAVQVPEVYFPAIVEFMTAYTQLLEDEFSEEGKVAFLFQRFDRAIRMGL